MKGYKFIIITLIFVSFSFFSCKTLSETYMQNGIDLFPQIQLEKLTSDDYTILETLKGTSEIIISKEELIGDTGKYGVFDDSFATKNILEMVTNPKWRLDNAEGIAKLNATYDIIEKANKIQADAIWMPRTSKEVIVERNRIVIRVTIIAKAVQIINK